LAGPPWPQLSQGLSARRRRVATGDILAEGGANDDIPILTETEIPLKSASFSFGVGGNAVTTYKGLVIVAGTGAIRSEGTGTLTAGVLTSLAVTNWITEGVVLNDTLIEVMPVGIAEVTARSYTALSLLDGDLTLDDCDESGAVSWRVVEGPKVIDPEEGTVTPLFSVTGIVPTGAVAICSFLDRLVYVKDRVWYMSRQGDPYDYDYGADAFDRGRAVAGTASDAGQPGRLLDASHRSGKPESFVRHGMEPVERLGTKVQQVTT
jgi:hypothetical protein